MPPLLPQERSDRNEALPSGESALDGLWGPWAVPVTAPVSQPFTCRLGLGLGPGATASSPRPGRLGKGSQPLDEAMGPVPLLRRHRRLLGESRSAPHVASSSCPRALRRGSEAGNQGSPHPTAPAALARNRRASIPAIPLWHQRAALLAPALEQREQMTNVTPRRADFAQPSRTGPLPLIAAARAAGGGWVQIPPDGSTDPLTRLRSLSSAPSRRGLGPGTWSPERWPPPFFSFPTFYVYLS